MLNQFNIKTVMLTLAMASPIGAAGAGFNNMYVIGDSLSDQGNLFSATYALTGIGIPASPYFEGRFANGEIYAGVLAEKIGVPLSPSLDDFGNNFANGGARTDYNIVEDDFTKPSPVPLLCQNGVLDPISGVCTYPNPEFSGFPEEVFTLYDWTLDRQTEAFHNRAVYNPDALYVVFAGANDLADLLVMVARCSLGDMRFCEGRGDPFEAFPVVLGTFSDEGIPTGGINAAIAAFKEAGAKHIVVPLIPDLGVIPAIRANGPLVTALATGLSMQLNAALYNVLRFWENVGNVNIIPFDTFSLTNEVANNAAAFGFSNSTDPCYTGFVDPPGPQDTVCVDPDSYVFWDKEHPTAAFHAVLAKRMLGAIILDILDHLFREVGALDVKAGTKASLNDKLVEADEVLTDENTNNDLAAVNIFRAFINSVETKRGKKIPDDAADSLVDSAEKLIQLIEAG